MGKSRPGWKPWGDHPIVVSIILITAVIGAIATILSLLRQEPQSEYLGRVLDSRTLTPIRDAKITFDFEGAPRIVYTDSEGVYRFRPRVNTTEKAGRIRVDSEGYDSYERNITLSSKQLQLEEIRLSPISSSSTMPTTSQAQPTATQDQATIMEEYSPKPELLLAISKTPDLDEQIENPRIANRENTRRIPEMPTSIQRRTNIQDDYYLWVFLTNRNPNPRSCLSDIVLDQPEYKLTAEESVVTTSNFQVALHEIFPVSTINVIEAEDDKTVMSLDGQLLAREPAQGPIMLTFYKEQKSTNISICGTQTLAIALGAFRYTRYNSLTPGAYLTGSGSI